MTLVWSPESIHDLIALRAYIAEHDPASAKRVAQHILYCVEDLLSENPKLGAAGRVPGTRELVIPKTPYIVPYRVRGSTIEIVRVYHSSPPLAGTPLVSTRQHLGAAVEMGAADLLDRMPPTEAIICMSILPKRALP
jgi:toxin ParE1/3/4